jgi:hypothetical protein
MGFVMNLIGLPKGREIYCGIVLSAFTLHAVTSLRFASPFWTAFGACLDAALGAPSMQAACIVAYRRHNPWHHDAWGRPNDVVARGRFGLGIATSRMFGIFTGAFSWLFAALQH